MLKTYRYHFIEKESDVTIISDSKKAILRAKRELSHQREILEKYIANHKRFLTSFTPVEVHSEHDIIKLMSKASYECNVGPMAAVAGALADLMLKVIKQKDESFPNPAKVGLVENGGEIAIDSEKSMKVALYAGYNELNSNIGFLIEKHDCPIGIATSSATIGHAISLGQADAVTIFAKNATLADAAATKIANLVKGEDIEKSIKKALDAVDDLVDIQGAFISRKNKIGKTGNIPKMIKIKDQSNKIIKGKIKNVLSDNFDVL
jgi:hypothetical protein